MGHVESARELREELERPEAGPKPTSSLARRGAPLAASEQQLALLGGLPLQDADFAERVAAHGFAPLRPATLEIFQINIGKLCNMTCRHCHVDAGPDRVVENMDRATIDACLRALDASPSVHTVDITGGAPELHPHFRDLVEACVARGKHVIDRCNLTVLLLPRCADLPAWLAERGVEISCSLPHYRKLNTDAQRGRGTYEKSLQALRLLNGVGYGTGDPRRRLTLVSNPAGAFLSGDQAALEREWKTALREHHGIRFDRLIAINNMPISRFLDWLQDSGNLQPYMQQLVGRFNPETIPNLMCRNTLSIGWDGRMFDCDFNQMLDLELQAEGQAAGNIRDFDPRPLGARSIVTNRHCFGCSAGSGSGCGGALTA